MLPIEAVTCLKDCASNLGLERLAVARGQKWISEPGAVPDGIDRRSIRLQFRRIAVCVSHAVLPRPFIEVTCDINASGETIGSYRLITDLDGKEEDDYWVVDEKSS